MRSITAAELLTLAKQGARIKVPEPPPAPEPERVRDVLERIAAILAEPEEPETPTDMTGVQDALLAVAAAVGNRATTVTLGPATAQALQEIAANSVPRARPAYTFEIVRNQRGQIETVRATPDE